MGCKFYSYMGILRSLFYSPLSASQVHVCWNFRVISVICGDFRLSMCLYGLQDPSPGVEILLRGEHYSKRAYLLCRGNLKNLEEISTLNLLVRNRRGNEGKGTG